MTQTLGERIWIAGSLRSGPTFGLHKMVFSEVCSIATAASGILWKLDKSGNK